MYLANFKIAIVSAVISLFVNRLPARTYSILVGIEDYKFQKSLNYAADDARLMYGILARPEHVATTVLLLDANASKKNIVKYMSKVARSIKADDTLIFYFAGHGLGSALICHDAVADYQLTYGEIRAWLKKCKTKRKFVFLDSCSATNLFATTEADYCKFVDYCSRPKSKKPRMQTAGELYVLFLASDRGEVSYELPKYKHGVFTFYLARGLLGESDRNQDGLISIEELYFYVRNKTYTLSKSFSNGTQCPILIGNFDKNIVLAVSK